VEGLVVSNKESNKNEQEEDNDEQEEDCDDHNDGVESPVESSEQPETEDDEQEEEDTNSTTQDDNDNDDETQQQGRRHFNVEDQTPLPESPVFEPETVNLRNAEQYQYTYNWEHPWTKDAHLRNTDRGKALKRQETLTSPVTHANKLIQDGIVKWQEPEWTKKPLRKTTSGDLLKQKGCLAKPASKLIENGQVSWATPEWAKTKSPFLVLKESDDDIAKEEQTVERADKTTLTETPDE